MTEPRISSVVPEGDRPQVDAQHPWPGLPSFGEADRGFFFGREAEADELTQRIELNRLTVLFGSSGLGKSSLLKAGVFPRLRLRDYLPVHLRLALDGGAAHASDQVLAALESAARRAAIEMPAKDPTDSVWEYLHRKEAKFRSESDRPITPVLVFDQFEEVLRSSTEADLAQERDRAIEIVSLLAEGGIPQSVKKRFEEKPALATRFSFSVHPYRIVIALREDYLADLEELRSRMPSVAANRMRLSHMRGLVAIEAVLDSGRPGHLLDGPVAMAIVRFIGESESRKGGVLLDELPIEPTLLSVICRELNHERLEKRASSITLQQLDRDKGEILQKFYERAFTGVSASIREFVEERLVTADGTRELVARQTFLRTSGITEADLDTLINQRVLRQEERDGRRLIELTHDRLAPVASASRDQRRAAEAERQTREAAEERQRALEAQQAETLQRLRASRRQTRVIAALFVLAVLGAAVAIWAGVTSRRAQQVATKSLAAVSFREAVVRAVGGRPLDAMAFAARTIRLDPENSVARALGLDLLRTTRVPLQAVLHEGSVVAVAWSPDGTRVLTGSEDHTARVWDARTGQPVGAALQHQDEVVAVAWSPDGTRVLTGSSDNSARVWDARTGQPVGAALQHQGGVLAVAWSPDSTRVLTGSKDKSARVWDADTGQPMSALLQDTRSVVAVAWSPDGTRVLTGSDDAVRVWDAHTGQPVGAPLHEGSAVVAVAWSPDGTRVLTASNDGSARVWDARTGQPVGAPVQHQEAVTAVAWSPDGTHLLTGSLDKSARVWDASTGQPVGAPMQHQDMVWAVAWSPDGRRVLTGSWDKSAGVWDASTGQPVGAPLRHLNAVVAVAWSPDGTRILTGSWDKSARVWDARIGPVGAMLLHHGMGQAMAWSPDGTRVLTGSGDNSARVWDARTGQPVSATLRHQNAIHAVAWSPDGTRILTGSSDGSACVWDASTGQPIGKPLQPNDVVWAVAWSPDGTRVLTGSYKSAQVWDARTGQPVGAELHHKDSVKAVAWSPDSTRVLTGSDDKSARVWDARTGQPIGALLQHEDAVVAVAWSPDGTRVLTGSFNKSARLWDSHTGQPVGAPLQHQDAVVAVAWSPDGTRVLTGSGDKSARVWDARSGQPVGEPLQHQDQVMAVAWSPDGTRVLTGSSDKSARVWDARTGQPIGAPLQHQDAVVAVAWSPDATRVLTGSQDDSARVWDAPVGVPADARRLAETLELVSERTVNDDGALVTVSSPEAAKRLAPIRREAAASTAPPGSLDQLLQWFFTDPRERTISPLSAMSMDEYVTRMLSFPEKFLENLVDTYPGHPKLRAAQQEAAKKR